MRPFKPHKYRAKPTRGYASKRESEFADLLRMRAEIGEVRAWLEQVPIKIPGSKYVIDFVVFEADGRVRFVEIKGHATETWKVKHRALSVAHPWIFERLEVLR